MQWGNEPATPVAAVNAVRGSLSELISRQELGNLGVVMDNLPARTALTAAELDEAHAVAQSAPTGSVHRPNGPVVAWGRSDEYQLGHDAKDLQPFPRRVPGIAVAVAQVAAAAHHTLARTADGTVLAWGTNKFGRLGTGDENMRASPTPVQLGGDDDGAGEVAVHIAAATDHSVVVTLAGHAYAFGRNHCMQLGLGATMAQSETPRRVGQQDVRFVSAAASPTHTLLLASGGAVFAAGADDRGQCRALGGTRGKNVKRFTAVPGLGGAVAGVAACEGASAGWTEAGEALAWGDGLSRPQRLRVPMLRCARVALSTAVVAVLDEDGGLWTRGSRAELLGHAIPDGADRSTRAHRSALKRVEGLPRVVDVSCGERHVCAADASGRVWAWGEGHCVPMGYLPQPRVVEGVRGAVAVSAGPSHTAVVVGARDPVALMASGGEAADSLLAVAQRQALATLDVFRVMDVLAVAAHLDLHGLRAQCERFIRLNLDVMLALCPQHARLLQFVFPGDPELDSAALARCTSPVFRGASPAPRTASPVHRASSPRRTASPVQAAMSPMCLDAAAKPPLADALAFELAPHAAASASASAEDDEEAAVPARAPAPSVGQCDTCGVVFHSAASRADHLLGALLCVRDDADATGRPQAQGGGAPQAARGRVGAARVAAARRPARRHARPADGRAGARRRRQGARAAAVGQVGRARGARRPAGAGRPAAARGQGNIAARHPGAGAARALARAAAGRIGVGPHSAQPAELCRRAARGARRRARVVGQVTTILASCRRRRARCRRCRRCRRCCRRRRRRAAWPRRCGRGARGTTRRPPAACACSAAWRECPVRREPSATACPR